MNQLRQNPTDRHELLIAVAESDLLSDHQLAKLNELVPEAAGSAPEAADVLVGAQILTRFQADRLLAGRTDGFILGPHAIQEQIGKGSVGRVYRATHRSMHRNVAIKVFSADITRTAATRQAFHREVRAAARLNHPNIVTAFDANEIGDRFYLVMEFVDGPTVDEMVRKRGPLPWPEACELVRQIAVGLQHAHERGMVHRDIKPANLLVAKASPSMPGCVVKIADFGIARIATSEARTTATVVAGLTGTPDYVAPEQAYNPHAADHRADLYSLGCVFYFLLCGKPPFPGGTTADKVRRHQLEQPTPIEKLRADLPPPVAEIVNRLLAKDPNQRIATAAGVAARLDGLAASAVVREDGGQVNFELPPVQPGPYSFTSGYLTGMHSVADQATETTPWSQLTDEMQTEDATDPAQEATPFQAPVSSKSVRAARRRRGTSPLIVLSVCGAIVGACILALGYFIRMMG
ncbi:MAG TPA: serine/threonine-protein kinase [Urbifossiella sp.]|nr:serine/threonine-protein kinase [Urbifossiella sp.]